MPSIIMMLTIMLLACERQGPDAAARRGRARARAAPGHEQGRGDGGRRRRSQSLLRSLLPRGARAPGRRGRRGSGERAAGSVAGGQGQSQPRRLGLAVPLFTLALLPFMKAVRLFTLAKRPSMPVALPPYVLAVRHSLLAR
eukprot:1766395-Rhodomonas_salina.1